MAAGGGRCLHQPWLAWRCRRSWTRCAPYLTRAGGEAGALHAGSLLTLAVCAMLCGARSLYAIAQWGHERESGALAAALGFEWGRSPSVAMLFRTFRDLDVAAFERVLAAWLSVDAPPAEALALDGKTLRGIHREAVPGVHLVAAYAHSRGAVSGEKGRRPVLPAGTRYADSGTGR